MATLSRQVRVAAFAIAALTAMALTSVAASAATGPGAAPASRLVALEGSVNPPPGSPAGGYSSPQMSVEVTLAPRGAGGLAAELRAAYTPGTGGYHQWLAPGQFDAKYAPAAAQRAAVDGYLQSAGLSVVGSATPFLVR